MGHGKKGKYDVFYAFAVEWLLILGEMLRSKDITVQTFLKLKQETLTFCMGMAIDFIILRCPCSYDTSSFGKSMRVFYSWSEMGWGLIKFLPWKVARKINVLLC